MKILITGGAGFIGSHVVEHYQGRAEICVLDNLRTGQTKNLEGLDCRLVDGSILDEALVNDWMAGVDYVFHLAAMVSVAESMHKISETVALNVNGLLNVLEAASKHGVKKLCLASSAAVYGNRPEALKHEDLTPDPQSPYAITKLDGEYYCGLYQRERGLETACLRFFNVFGPRQNPRSAYAAAVPIFLHQALHNEPITIFGTGTQTRDFVYVKDVVGALAFAAETPGVSGVFNVGCNKSLSILELAKEIIRLTNSRSEIQFLPSRVGDLQHSEADVSKLKSMGWQPEYSVATGLQALIC
jgi:UDP-glucose 4-epimerase